MPAAMLRLRQPSVSPGFEEQPPSSLTRTASLNPSQARIYQMLSSYISIMRRDDILSRLNHILNSRVTLAQGSAITNMKGYYTIRPGLRKYTLGVEMDRAMDYTLITKEGQSTSDKSAIRSYFGVRDNENKLTQCGEVATEELLIRAANQSLLADALAALTGSEEVLQPCIQKNVEEKKGLILCGPILSMSSTVEKCHFTIDLERERVEAICVLAVNVPVKNKRLVLARGILVAKFQPMTRKGQLQYTMTFVKSHHLPLSKIIRDAAIFLAKDQENLLLQSGHHENAFVKENAKSSQRLFSLFR